MELGTILSITEEDNQLICEVDFGSDDVEPIAIYGTTAGVNNYPLVGDQVAVSRSDEESFIVAVFGGFDGAANGDCIIYSRDTDGNQKASVAVYSDGSVRMANENGHIDLATNGQVNINDNFTVDV